MKKFITIVVSIVGGWASISIATVIVGIIISLISAALPVVGVAVVIAGGYILIDKYSKSVEGSEIICKSEEILNKAIGYVKNKFNTK